MCACACACVWFARVLCSVEVVVREAGSGRGERGKVCVCACVYMWSARALCSVEVVL